MTATRKPLVLALVAFSVTGCGKWADDLFCASEGCAWKEGEWARVAALANPGPPPADLSNALRDDPYALLLGQAFFFDPDFSGVATQQDAIKRMSPPARVAAGQPLQISCASCHDLARAGVDTTSEPGHVSVGAGWTDVNALPVVNSAYRPIVFWNGRADSLWALNALVAESWTTMNGNRLRTAHLLVDKYLRPGYWPPEPGLLAELGRLLMQPSFDCAALLAAMDQVSAMPLEGKPTTPEFDNLTSDQKRLVNSLLVVWAKAIAAYESTLISVDAPFDRFVRAGSSSDLISPAARRGARLFVGKAACVDCHNGPQLTDEQFHNIGIPQTGLAVPQTTDCPAGNAACDCSADHPGGPCAPWGAYDGLTKLRSEKVGKMWSRNSDWSDFAGDTTSSAYFNREPTDDLKGAWRTPSLRNVALTAPYMHDGRYATLQDVVWHYNTGGASAGPEQVGVRAAQIKPLLLTEAEQSDLVAFLETLTGDPLLAGQTEAPGLPPHPPPSCSGAGGAGGSGGTAPRGCEGTRVTSPLITDFGDATPDNPPRFGSASTVAGSSFSYAAPGLALPVLSTAQGNNGTPALKVAVDTGAPTDPSAMWFGFGLSFESCLDLKPYDAVQFTIAGDVVACPIRFAVTSSQTVNHDNDPRGTCRDASCYPPSVPIPGPGTVVVPLSNLTAPGSAFPGNPNLVDPGSVIGLQWQMDAPGRGCTASLQIDDIMLVSTGAPTGTGGRGPPLSGAGGMGGGTGGIATGAGGSGGAAPKPVTCTPMPLQGPLVTDFNSAFGANPVVFMSSSGISGRTFSYGPANVVTPWPTLAPGANGTAVLRFATRAAPPPGTGFYSFGLTFDNCVDARAFYGVRFALDNPVGPSCPVEVAVTSRANVTSAEDPRGACPSAGACAPQFMAVPQAGTVTAPFPPMSAAFEPGALIGIQWRVPASCNASFTVDDIVLQAQ